MSAGCFDTDHQLGVSRFGTGCRCCKCNHGNIASSLALQWCNLLFPAAWASVFGVDVTVARCVMCAFPPTVSQRLLRFPGYLRHQGNQGKCCYQPRYAEKKLQKQWSGSSLFEGFCYEKFNQWLMPHPKIVLFEHFRGLLRWTNPVPYKKQAEILCTMPIFTTDSLIMSLYHFHTGHKPSNTHFHLKFLPSVGKGYN